jgi:biotin-dependent carboxylase-like uncharacterized protein
MRILHVIEPGPRTTVEDPGRRGVARWGIPAGGAFDALALVAANRLVGNRDDDAGLEVTLGGPTLANAGDEPLVVALTGADCDARLVHGAASAPVRPGLAVTLPVGDVLRTGFARTGARAWLAIAGGIAVPRIAGSRSTALGAAFGGLHGRALARGDVLPVGVPRRALPPAAARGPWCEPVPPAACMPLVLRVLPGPQLACFPGDPLRALADTVWRVQNDSDRTGVRLAPADGEPPAELRGVEGIAPEGTTLGAIQVPPDGRPIVLGPDRPVTGGYAKPAVVALADVGRLALLRPGDTVRLTPVSLDEALSLAAARRATLPARPA